MTIINATRTVWACPVPPNLYLYSLTCTTLRRIVPSRQHLQHLEGQIRAAASILGHAPDCSNLRRQHEMEGGFFAGRGKDSMPAVAPKLSERHFLNGRFTRPSAL